jgi:flagellar hook-associated protein 2
MAGTISFGGIASGMDTEGIVTGLVQASRGTVDAMKARSTTLTSATSSLSKIGTLLAKLKTTLEAVDDAREVGGFTATSSNAAISPTALGTALPGSYSIKVDSLAKEQRSYSTGYASSTTALGASGNLGISVAGGTVKDIALVATDTLENVAAKINAAGLRVSASVFHDGTQYRLQVNGSDTGEANTIAFSGTTLGLELAANKRQSATDAQIKIDDFTVKRPTNQIVGAMPGVTLNLTATTTDTVTVKVATDTTALSRQMTSVVDAYNAVIDTVHSAAGFGATKAGEKALAGDSMLRSLESRMLSALGQVVGSSGAYRTMGAIGVALGKDGRLSLDATKLTKALTEDPASVAAVIAGGSSGNGAADILRDVVTAFGQTGSGLLALRKETLDSRSKALTERISREESRLTRYADQLRKQFSAMDSVVGANAADTSYLTKLYG